MSLRNYVLVTKNQKSLVSLSVLHRPCVLVVLVRQAAGCFGSFTALLIVNRSDNKNFVVRPFIVGNLPC